MASPPSCDIAAHLETLTNLLTDSVLFPSPFPAPPTILQALDTLIHFLSTHATRDHLENDHHIENDHPGTQLLQPEAPVRINRQTTAAGVIWHPVDAHIDYPLSSVDSRIAHVFAVDPGLATLVHPKSNIAYGLGSPMGMHNNRRCELLKDGNGDTVLCKETMLTCQGVKVCDRAESSFRELHYTEATMAALQDRLKHDISSPQAVLLKKTIALKAALEKYGCGCKRDEVSYLSQEERERVELQQAVLEKERRGQPLEEQCEGRLIFGRHPNGQAYVKCEHYSSKNRQHLLDHRVQETDEEYMEALFDNDQEEISAIEESARSGGYGPLVPCLTTANSSSMRVFCPHEHRDAMTGSLVQGNMVSQSCQAKFQIYEPYDLLACPYILILASGAHTHPLPLPLSTPMQVQTIVIDLLQRMHHELADATPRRFMRHPAVRSHLRDLLGIPSPTLIDLHISLANKDHLRVYIKKAKEERYPHGTGWEGVSYYQSIQAPEEQYVRILREVPSRDKENPTPYRIIVCMTPAMSLRLSRAQWIQSDISFKRAPGTLEFELVGWDRSNDRSDVYARAYLNRQTAEAHRALLHLIDSVVFNDTGQKLQWRHIHSENASDSIGALQWAGDQHAGQALGIGLYLQDRSEDFPLKFDLHEPTRLLVSLTPYDHLRRIFRLCSVHVKRNIKESSVSGDVKNLMRSLLCVRHLDVEGTLQAISRDGQKAGRDWVHDKRRSRFALPGMCWELSYILKDVWLAGESNTNVSETAHADVYREGTGCTLLGAVAHGEQFDREKDRSIRAAEESGVRPSYKPPSVSARAHKNVKRTLDARLKSLAAADSHIRAANKTVSSCHKKVLSCSAVVSQAESQLHDLESSARPTNRRRGRSGRGDVSQGLDQARTRLQQAQLALRKAETNTEGLKGGGTGKVEVLQHTAVQVERQDEWSATRYSGSTPLLAPHLVSHPPPSFPCASLPLPCPVTAGSYPSTHSVAPDSVPYPIVHAVASGSYPVAHSVPYPIAHSHSVPYPIVHSHSIPYPIAPSVAFGSHPIMRTVASNHYPIPPSVPYTVAFGSYPNIPTVTPNSYPTVHTIASNPYPTVPSVPYPTVPSVPYPIMSAPFDSPFPYNRLRHAPP